MSPETSPFRLLVFDWDGTLMDSIGTIVACTQTTIAALGLGELPDARIRDIIGLGLRETIEILAPGCDETLYLRIAEGYRHHWVSTYRDMPLLFDGVTRALRELESAGYLLAVATGKSRRGLDYALEQTGLSRVFAATRTADEAFSKPHPQMLLDILDGLGLRAHEAVMVGDTTFDLEMASNAGMPAVGVLSGSHGRDELERCGPLACLSGVAELPRWLAGCAAAAPPTPSSTPRPMPPGL
jgi:phosphoglycolate phosphatase